MGGRRWVSASISRWSLGSGASRSSPSLSCAKGYRWLKRPHIVEWSTAATCDLALIEEWFLRWPLAVPGIPLKRMGWVVVDCDRHREGQDGPAEFAALGPFPEHPIVATAGGGEHHYFLQPAQPAQRVTLSRWAGGEVLGDGRFVVGYSVPAAPEVVVPEVFQGKKRLVDASAAGSSKNLMSGVRGGVGAASLTEALRKLNPVGWRGQRDQWLMLMNACKFVGVARDDFVGWSVGDPVYAGDENEIAAQWESLSPQHGGALWAALKAAGITVTKGHTHHDADVHTPH